MAGFIRSGSSSPTPEQIARNCRRLGWVGFWLQAVLGLIPLLVVLGLVFSRLGQWPGGLFSLGLWLAILCLGFLIFSTYWSFRYTRMARRLEVPEARPSKSGVKRTLRVGLLANLAVMAIAVLIALGRVSQLTFRMLTVPQGATVVAPNQLVAQGALVSPSNMLAIQAMVYAIAAGLVGVIIALLLIQQVSLHRNAPDAFL
jgi:hypothetical protein